MRHLIKIFIILLFVRVEFSFSQNLTDINSISKSLIDLEKKYDYGYQNDVLVQKQNNEKIEVELINLAKKIKITEVTSPYFYGILVSIINKQYKGNDEIWKNINNILIKEKNLPFTSYIMDKKIEGWTEPETLLFQENLVKKIPANGTGIEEYNFVLSDLLKYIPIFFENYKSQARIAREPNGKISEAYYYNNYFFSVILDLGSQIKNEDFKSWSLKISKNVEEHFLKARLLFFSEQFDKAEVHFKLALEEYKMKGWQTLEIEDYINWFNVKKLIDKNSSIKTTGISNKNIPSGWILLEDFRNKEHFISDFNEDGLLDEAVLCTFKSNPKSTAVFIILKQKDGSCKVQKIAPIDIPNHSNDKFYQISLNRGYGNNEPFKGIMMYRMKKDAEYTDGSEPINLIWDKSSNKMIFLKVSY